MQSGAALLHYLKIRGERITAVRRALIGIFLSAKGPFSAPEIVRLFKAKRLAVNKTTVYRQLKTLHKHNLLHEVRLEGRTVRYELAEPNDHHHHLVCLRCHKIEEVSFPGDVAREERAIWKQARFKVRRHALEFFGWCQKCQRKS